MHTIRNKYLRKISSMVRNENAQQAIELFVRPYHTCQTLESIARSLGVSEIVQEPLPFDGGIFEEGAGLKIKLNSLSPHARRRFTLAHEIGHLLLQSLQNGRGASVCQVDRELEQACDLIATELLLPTQAVRAFVGAIGGPSTEKLKALADAFQVSLHAAARRAREDLKVWKSSFGLWKWNGRATEVWFAGKRPWSTRNPSFAAFGLATESQEAVRTREFYSQGQYAQAVSLEVLSVGRNHLLGMVA